ncbi:hypothetical protein, partial [Sphingobacterium deserti]|uniref:hypothetical protein n=1 Tax=Sphingobacterium deserti TaxID=1229276 RepID=UPI0019D3AD25
VFRCGLGCGGDRLDETKIFCFFFREKEGPVPARDKRSATCRGKFRLMFIKQFVPRSNPSAACRGRANTFVGQKYSKPRRLKPLQGRFVQWQMSTYCKAFDATFRLIMVRSNKVVDILISRTTLYALRNTPSNATYSLIRDSVFESKNSKVESGKMCTTSTLHTNHYIYAHHAFRHTSSHFQTIDRNITKVKSLV